MAGVHSSAALVNINMAKKSAPGSIWNRNSELYGGKARADAFMAKARSIMLAAEGETAAEPVAAVAEE